MNNQKTNKERTRIVSEEDMRQNVLKSGLVNELMSGVLDENGELPTVEEKGVPASVQVENIQASEPLEMPMPSDTEFEKYFEDCRANCTADQVTMDSLLLKIYDLILQKNKLVEVILQMQNTAGPNQQMQNGEQMQSPNRQMQGQMQNSNRQMQGQMQGQKQNPNRQMQGGRQMQNGQMGNRRSQSPQMGDMQMQSGNMPMSTGSTRQTMKKRDFIPKSQVEKMTREEIREVFDLIDRSRKEW